MKQRLIIILAILLILMAAFFMVRDFFYGNEKDVPNPYEYDLSEFQKVDEDLICYKESGQWKPGIKKLKGIAIDSKDRVYVTGDNKVVVYDRNGLIVGEFSLENEANCIAVGPEGEIYLGASDHVEAWDFSGNLQKKWDSPSPRTLVTSIAVNDSLVYVADAGTRVVHQYTLTGKYIREIGRRNKATGEQGFIIPSPYFDILLGREGELWAVNPGMHSLQSYNHLGEPVSSWSRTSMQLDGFSGCCNPSHIALLSNGSFVTSEKGIERIKIHLPSGDFHCVVAGPDQFEPGTVGLDLAVDSGDRIFVMDPRKEEVRIYQPR